MTEKPEFSARIEYLAPDGMWRTNKYLAHISSPEHIAYLREGSTLWKTDTECVETSAKCASKYYVGTVIRTLYGDSDSPASVYVDGYSVREDWIDRDFGHPNLMVTV